MSKSLVKIVRESYGEDTLREALSGEKTVEAEPKKTGRKPLPTLSQSFKAFKDSPEYGRLYEATLNREYVIEHLIYRAFAAGFKAK